MATVAVVPFMLICSTRSLHVTRGLVRQCGRTTRMNPQPSDHCKGHASAGDVAGALHDASEALRLAGSLFGVAPDPAAAATSASGAGACPDQGSADAGTAALETAGGASTSATSAGLDGARQAGAGAGLAAAPAARGMGWWQAAAGYLGGLLLASELAEAAGAPDDAAGAAREGRRLVRLDLDTLSVLQASPHGRGMC